MAAALLCVLCVGEFLLLCCVVVFHLLPLLSGLFELIQDGDGSSLLCAPCCVNLEFPPRLWFFLLANLATLLRVPELT